jgi:hypothetical protein
MIEWKLESVEIKKLKSHSKNPRQINKPQLTKLTKVIDKFGMIDKPIVNLDYTIIGGHQRVSILKKKRVKFVECWMPNVLLESKDVDELCIGLNLHQGSWDVDVLANDWDMADLLSYGFTEDYLVGIDNTQEIEPPKPKEKKVKMCPNCGHEL